MNSTAKEGGLAIIAFPFVMTMGLCRSSGAAAMASAIRLYLPDWSMSVSFSLKGCLIKSSGFFNSSNEIKMRISFSERGRVR